MIHFIGLVAVLNFSSVFFVLNKVSSCSCSQGMNKVVIHFVGLVADLNLH